MLSMTSSYYPILWENFCRCVWFRVSYWWVWSILHEGILVLIFNHGISFIGLAIYGLLSKWVHFPYPNLWATQETFLMWCLFYLTNSHFQNTKQNDISPSLCILITNWKELVLLKWCGCSLSLGSSIAWLCYNHSRWCWFLGRLQHEWINYGVFETKFSSALITQP